MCSDKQRVATYLQTSINEMELIEQMAAPIHEPNQFGLDITGMTIFRACSMSLQYITENFIKIRNIATEAFFASYRQIPWKSVFGMRNFLVHEYVDVDDEAIFKTIKEDLPILKETSLAILYDLNEGKLDKFFKNQQD